MRCHASAQPAPCVPLCTFPRLCCTFAVQTCLDEAYGETCSISFAIYSLGSFEAAASELRRCYTQLQHPITYALSPAIRLVFSLHLPHSHTLTHSLRPIPKPTSKPFAMHSPSIGFPRPLALPCPLQHARRTQSESFAFNALHSLRPAKVFITKVRRMQSERMATCGAVCFAFCSLCLWSWRGRGANAWRMVRRPARRVTLELEQVTAKGRRRTGRREGESLGQNEGRATP